MEETLNAQIDEVLKQLDMVKQKIQNGEAVSLSACMLTNENEIVTVLGGYTFGMMMILGFTVGRIQEALNKDADGRPDPQFYKELMEHFNMGMRLGKEHSNDVAVFSSDKKHIAEPGGERPGWATDAEFFEDLGRQLKKKR